MKLSKSACPTIVFAFIAIAVAACRGEGDGDGGDFHYFDLVYDDGTVESASAPKGTAAGGMIAVRFTPSITPATLTSATFLVATAGTPTTEFGVRVFLPDGTGGMPGSELTPTAITAQATTGDQWVDIDLASHEMTIDSGEFYVAMEWLTATGTDGASAQFLGVDQSSPDTRSLWKWASSTVWEPIADIGTAGDRDAMIRCTVQAWVEDS